MAASLSEDRVSWHLWNWHRWVSANNSPGKLPKTASGGIQCYRSWDTDGEYEEADRVAGAAVQAVLDGMTPRHRISVYVQHGVMAAVYRLRDAETAYTEACGILGAQLAKRGLC